MSVRIPSLSESRTLRGVAFFCLYVVEGIPSGFAGTALANALAARGLSPSDLGAFAGAVGLPWAFQFIWGPVIDRFQGSPMGRRKPWVLFAQLASSLASLGLLTIRDPARELSALTLAFFVHGVFSSIQDASVDAMAISVIPEAERGRINACMRGGLLFGGGLGGAGLAWLIGRAGFFGAALAQSLTLLALTAATAFIRERPGDSLVPWGRRSQDESTIYDVNESKNLKHLFAELARGLFARRSLTLFGAMALVYTILGMYFRPLTVHVIQVLKWDDRALSVLMGVPGSIVGLATILVLGASSDRIGGRRLLIAMMLAIGGFLIAFNLIEPYWRYRAVTSAGVVLWFAFDPGFSIAAMPMLMGLCRRGVEGSQFTAYMAIVNLTGALGMFLAGHAQAYVTAPTIGLACGAIILATIPVVAWASHDVSTR